MSQSRGPITFQPRSIWTDHRDVERDEPAATRPHLTIPAGAAKCARKGHRPPNRLGQCSRCGDGVTA